MFNQKDPKHREKMSKIAKEKGYGKWMKYKTEDNSNNWKGDKVGNKAVHQWVVKWKGKPSKCEMCGTTSAKKFEWSNIDHSYKRVLEDYIRMCKSCHENYDRNKRKQKHGNI